MMFCISRLLLAQCDVFVFPYSFLVRYDVLVFPDSGCSWLISSRGSFTESTMTCFMPLVFILLLPALSAGSRILVIPSSQKSHVIMFSNAGRALREAGHSVDVLVEASSSWLVENAGLSAITYTEPLMSDTFLQDMLINPDVLESFAKLTTVTSKLVEGILQNADVMSTLENRHYDIALVDGLDFARALYVLPYSLGIRYITLTARHDPWNAGIPQLPSVESIPGIGNVITENSTMSERFQGWMTAVMLYLVMPSSVLDDSMIARYVPMRPKATFTDLFRNSEMWHRHRMTGTSACARKSLSVCDRFESEAAEAIAC